MDIHSQRETRGDNLAKLTKQAGVARGAYSLVRSIAFAAILIVVALILMFIGIPWFIWASVLFVAAAIVILDILTLKRTAGLDLTTPNKPVAENVGVEAEESLVGTIPAVFQYGKVRSTAVLGVGEVHTPENALLITNKAIWALTVPLLGADKVVSGTDIGMNQWMWAYKDIGDKLQEMLATLPLDEVLKQGRGQRLMGLDELKTAKTRLFSHDICLVRSDGKKYRYSIRGKDDYLRAKKMFRIS